MDPLHDDYSSSQQALQGVLRIRRGLQLLGVAGLIVAWFVPYLFPVAAWFWPSYLHIGIYSILPLWLLILGSSLRVNHPNSRELTFLGLWSMYGLGIIGGIVFSLFTGYAEMVSDFGSDPKYDTLREYDFNSAIAFSLFHLIGMLVINNIITRYLQKKEVINLFDKR